MIRYYFVLYLQQISVQAMLSHIYIIKSIQKITKIPEPKEYTIAVGGNVGIGTLIVFTSAFCVLPFPSVNFRCLHAMYERTLACNSRGN